MSLTLSQLEFDTANKDDGANVGAYLRDSAGALLISTLVGADQSLDVNLTQSVVISVDDNSGSLTVDGVDFDIRDLTHVSDSVKIGDGTDFLAIAVDGSIAVTDNGGSLTVDGVDFDIRDLTAVSDSVAAWLSDGSGNAITSSGGALDINIASSDIEIDVENDVANTEINSTAKSVSTTTGVLLASELAARRFMLIQNLGDKEIYIGESGVTTSTGIRVVKNAVAEFRLGPALSMHAVALSGTQDVRIMELA